MSIRRLLVLFSGVTLLASIGVAAPAAAAPGADHHYYLSLGDSLAFGYQPNLASAGDYNPADYAGYAEDYTAMHPGLTLVNYGCPGETSGSMLSGACPYTGPLHDAWDAPSQAAAAVAFLQAHPGQVDLITVDIGSNDLLHLVAGCGMDSTCITGHLPATLSTMAGNYATLLTELRQAAPDAQIVLFNFYNPLAVLSPQTDALAQQASQVVASMASTFHAGVADAFSAINNKAGSPSERTLVCSRTWICSSYTDVHPDAVGYQSLAAALQQAVARG